MRSRPFGSLERGALLVDRDKLLPLRSLTVENLLHPLRSEESLLLVLPHSFHLVLPLRQ